MNKYYLLSSGLTIAITVFPLLMNLIITLKHYSAFRDSVMKSFRKTIQQLSMIDSFHLL